MEGPKSKNLPKTFQ